MSILIKGMEMPRDKAVAVVIHPDGTAYTAEMVAGVCTEYLVDCPAVPVPKHGRMIDADAFIRNIAKLERVDSITAAGVIAFVNAAPTIIEAEDKE